MTPRNCVDLGLKERSGVASVEAERQKTPLDTSRAEQVRRTEWKVRESLWPVQELLVGPSGKFKFYSK